MRRNGTAELIKIAGLLGVSFFTFLPVYFMLVISLKDAAQFAQAPYVPTWPFHFSNFARAWQFVGPYIGHTLFVVVVATFLTVLMGSLCAFYFAQFNFTGKKLLFAYVIVLMMVPGILNLVPLYVLVTQMDATLKAAGQGLSAALPGDLEPRLLNSLWALILPAIAGGQVMMIFVLRQFFEAQPGALFEAARIDGASRLQLYRHIAFPLAKPIIATMAIVNVVTMWNDYVWPLLVLQKENYTVSVGLRYLEGQNFVEYGPLMAGYLMSSIPLLIMFLFSMRLFISGMASGAIKM